MKALFTIFIAVLLFAACNNSRSTSQLETSKERLSIEKADPADEIKKEKAALNGLVYAIIDVNDDQKERLRLVNELVQKCPEWFGAIDKVKIKNNELLGVLDIVNGWYEKKLLLISSQGAVQKAVDDVVKAQDEYDALKAKGL